jgi:hypothetical protein
MTTIISILDRLHFYRAAAALASLSHYLEMRRCRAANLRSASPRVVIHSRRGAA